MTIPGLGKLTPVQMMMVELSGRLIREYYPDANQKVFSDTERLWSMKRARTNLTRMTNLDFGFDLEQWHLHLLSTGEDHGYTHPYGWGQTKKIIEQSLANPETKRLAVLANQQNDNLGWFKKKCTNVRTTPPTN